MEEEDALIETISTALGVPRPFLNERNQAFTQLETWQQLTALLATQSVLIRPRGSYRTLDGIDIYVFECVICNTSNDRRYKWKIYRRDRHFQKYMGLSSEFLTSQSLHVPRLSTTYLKAFFTSQYCQDRLVELSKWLEQVVEIIQQYSHKLQQEQKRQDKDKLQALRQQRLAQLSQNSATKPHSGRSCSSSATNESMSSVDTSKLRVSSTIKLTTRARHWRRDSLKTIEQREDPVLYVLRTSKTDALPIVVLSCFLFAGANCPFPHVFQGMPRFALAMEELNVQITQAVPAPYPSVLKNSLTTRTGLGLRLTPSHEQDSQFLGAIVAGFLRDKHELDPALVHIPVGSRLVRVNGIDITNLPFNQVLNQLRSSGLPLRLRFVYNPYLNDPTRSLGMPRSSVSATSSAGSFSERHRASSNAGRRSGDGNAVADSVDSTSRFTDASHRSCSVSAASRSKPGVFGLMFGDLLGAKSGFEMSTASSFIGLTSTGIASATGKHHDKNADMASGVGNLTLLNGSGAALSSWDDINGESRDLVLNGFFSYLHPSLLHELRQKLHAETKAGSFLPEHDANGSDGIDDYQCVEDDAASLRCKAHGVWSTVAGPIGLSFGACRVNDVETAMLVAPPVFFSSIREHPCSEKHLCKGFVLVSINNESTFDDSFAIVIKRLRSATRPTSLCFRWWKDLSPFLETTLVKKNGRSNKLWTSLAKANAIEAKAFVSHLDCAAEAQTDLCKSLQLALMENASIRDEIGVLHDAHRKLRLAQEHSAKRELGLQTKIEQSDAVITKLKEELKEQHHELEKLRLRAQEADAKLATNEREYEIMLKEAQESAKARLAEHEEQLVKESNRSINDAKRLAERRAEKMLEVAANESQRKHEEYLQKLAEEHSNEVESLMQQVAVWRHQVEVLTEAEKRNYAALVSTGVNPYGDYQRSRFNHSSTDLPFADCRIGGNHDLPRLKGTPHDSNAATMSTAASKWHDGSPADDDTMDKRHTSSKTLKQSLQSSNNTFWDRMVSLLAIE